MPDTGKKILVVMENPAGMPHLTSVLFKDLLEESGHTVTACKTIIEGFRHLGDNPNKYDVVILDPLNTDIIMDGAMKEPAKLIALGVLARAKKGGAHTIVSHDADTGEHYDMAALRANTDQFVTHGNFEEMINAINTVAVRQKGA